MDSCPNAKTIGVMMFWASWTVGQFEVSKTKKVMQKAQLQMNYF